MLAGVKIDNVKVRSGVVPERDHAHTAAPDRTGTIIVIAVAVAATLGLLPWLGQSMFADEGATLYSAHLSWANLWAQSLHVDLVLLPYYVLMHGWVTVSGSIEGVRAFSLFAYFGTIVVVGWIGLRLAGRWCGVGAAALTATSTLLIEKSLSARPYEISVFLVTLCALVLFKWLEDGRGRWMWLFSLFAVLATAMQLFSLLAPTSMLFCALLVRPEILTQRLRALIAPLAPLAIVSCVWLVLCAGEVGQVNWIADESLEGLFSDEIRGPVIGQVYDVVLLAIFALIVFKFASTWNRDVRAKIVEGVGRDRDVFAVTLGWAVVPTLLLALASLVHPIYSVRYVSASAPGVALFVSFVCVRTFPGILDPARSSYRRAHKNQTRTAGAVGVAALLVLVIGYGTAASAQQEDLQTPALYVAEHAKHADAIALPDHAITSAFDYYLASATRHVQFWPQLGTAQPYVEGLDLSLHPADRLPGQVWVLDDGSEAGLLRFFAALKDEGYVEINAKQFNGSRLFIFANSAPTTILVSPATGDTLRGTDSELLALAGSTGAGISQVQFFLSGEGLSNRVIGTVGTGQCSDFGCYTHWNTTSVPNGTYSVQSVATNGLGKSVHSMSVVVTIDN